jgi:hypothetical protein
MSKFEFNNKNARLGLNDFSPSKKLHIGGQQTAVEWLIDRLLDGSLRFEETKMGFLISMNNDEIEQAKAMEKEQIMKSFISGGYDGLHFPKVREAFNREYLEYKFLEYYNQKYSK